MANFNSAPTGDNSANNGSYTPESFSDTDDTVQLPKLDENVDNRNDNDNPDTQPAADPEQNATESNNAERKSHLGRNLVVGGVAVVALAACIGIFNGSGDSSGSMPDTDNTPVAEETTDSDNIATPAPIIETPSNEGKSWIDIIGEEQRDEDDILLTTQQVADYLGTNPSNIATDSPYGFIDCIEEWSDFNNLDTAGNDLIAYNGQQAPFITTGFHTEEGFYISMMIGISPETGNFVIRLSAPSQTDNFYLYEDSSIPSTSILTDLVNKNVL